MKRISLFGHMRADKLRRISLFLASLFIAVTSLGITPAQAAVVTTVNCGSSGTFTITDNVVTGKNACIGSVVVPDGVTSIAGYAFYEATGVTSVQLPHTLISIGPEAFFGVTNLPRITFPASVTSIGSNAFTQAATLASIYFLGEAPTVGTYAFNQPAANKTAYIKGGVTSFTLVSGLWNGLIVNSNNLVASYSANGATSGTTPENPTPLYASGATVTVASNSGTLTKTGYTFSGWNTAANGLGVQKAATGSESLTISADTVFYAQWALAPYDPTVGTGFVNCGSSGSFEITANVVTRQNSCTGSAVIPPSVTSIGQAAFADATALTGISFAAGSTLTSIGDYAFAGVTSLASITIPSGVHSMGSGAFQGASALTAITVDGSNASFKDESGVLFDKLGTSIIKFPEAHAATSYVIPNSVASIDAGAFAYTVALAQVIIPSGVTSIGGSAFAHATALSSINIPSSVTTIDQSAFQGASSLAAVTFSAVSSLTMISSFLFAEATSLATITLPSSVTTIGDFSFAGAGLITSLSIPSAVTSIGASAFSGATRLAHVYFLGNAPIVAAGAFGSITPTIHVLNGATGFASLLQGLTVVSEQPAPVAAIVSPSPSVSGLSGTGSTRTIAGDMLGKVTGVKVNGVLVTLLSVTDDAVQITIPVLPVGFYDIELLGLSGSFQWGNALRITEVPTVAAPTIASRSFAGFAVGSAALTAAQKKAIEASVIGAKKITCVGSTSSTRSAKADRAIALKRAQVACAYAKSLVKTAVTRSVVAPKFGKSASARRVTLSVTK